MEQHNLLTVAIGTGYDKEGNVLSQKRVNEALEAFRLSVASATGGYTETAAKGGYVHHNGTLAQEPAAVFTLLVTNANAVELVQRAVLRVKEALNQESVLVINQGVGFHQFV